MAYTISKRFAFSASHRLDGLPDGHPCGRLHGHNYEVEVRLTRDTLDRHGFVLDYGLLAPFQTHVDTVLDHRHLNDVLMGQPSAEALAAYLWDTAIGCLDPVMPADVTLAVGVSETPKTWAWWSP